jgi:DNA-binding CsgD family transcriptional regulator
MLHYQQLLDIGTAADAVSLQARLSAAANELGFGIASGTLIRGRFSSGKALVRSFGNTPEGFTEAFKSADLGQRDPLLSRLLAQPGAVTYDQDYYANAGAGDLWEFQAPFGYAHGIAFAVHEPAHAEVFCLGIDGPDALPSDPMTRMLLEADLQLIALHAQDAVKRLYLPAPPPAAALDKQELEALQWAAEGVSVWKTGELMVISEADARRVTSNAARKLGASNRPAAVLRAIQGGLIER